MKTRSLFLCITFIITHSYSQGFKKNAAVDVLTNSPVAFDNQEQMAKPGYQTDDLSDDCSTVFWTVTTSGVIQEWDLSANQVTGGAIVQTGSGSSLAYCGDNGLTFYSTQYPSTGIKKYDATLGWTSIPTTVALLNSGGYLGHQFLYGYTGSLKDLYHFDGTTLTLVDHLGTDSFWAADIAVDSLGRAWVFTGSDISAITTLRVYSSTGLVASYPFAFNGWAIYGTFFINDQLYLGTADYNLAFSPNSIVPIIVNGTSVTTGTPIPFPYNNYGDMASCNNQANLGTPDYHTNKELLVYPNPATDIVTINLTESILSIMVYSIDGKLIKTVTNKNTVDISDLAKNTYLLKVISEKNVYNKLIQKK